ncbi:TetR/AcrR family transcriptional regulator [Nocardia sp. NPDC058058]|uniref:TetR/AcrR family transcriptional regulator n=1 Tax=Nocardia sp. NPDC058058 TaxID=3346317 RepID=UPI0036DA840A
MSSARPGKRTGRPRSLSESDIIAAALAEDLNTLSMPSVARRLGVAHSALYRYFPDRDSLVRAAMAQAIADIDWPHGTEPWREMLTALADRMWQVFERHPGFATAVLSIPGTPPGGVHLLERLARGLVAQGFTVRDAVLALDFLSDLTLTTFTMMSNLDTPFDGRTVRDAYRTTLTEGELLTQALDDDSVWRGRGWLDDKIAVMLDGLEHRRGTA